MKKRILPSADTVGLNSGYCVFIFGPRFSILITVSALITFSFCGISAAEVSWEGCEIAAVIQLNRIKKRVALFKAVDFGKAAVN